MNPSNNIELIIEDLLEVAAATKVPEKHFYHTASCKFEEPNTHRTVFVGKNHRAFNIASKGRPDMNELQTFIEKLLEHQGDDFYLNEFPDSVTHVDIDAPVTDESIEAIKYFIGESIEGDPQIKVLRNDTSGKVHMMLNVSVMNVPGDNTYVATLRYLRDYLYQVVEHEFTPAEWNAAFDYNAKSLRSAYSVKMDRTQVMCRDVYIPVDDFLSKTIAIFSTSMYLLATAR
jgi:hypothetical protein